MNKYRELSGKTESQKKRKKKATTHNEKVMKANQTSQAFQST